MFVVLVKVQVRPELLDEFKTAILRNASLSVERDPGCLRFDVLQQQDDSTRWYFYEVYEREQAWIDHRSSAHFLAFKDVGDRAILSRDVTKLTGVNMNWVLTGPRAHGSRAVRHPSWVRRPGAGATTVKCATGPATYRHLPEALTRTSYAL
jgi:autoinducer 2-degrading protein